MTIGPVAATAKVADGVLGTTRHQDHKFARSCQKVQFGIQSPNATIPLAVILITDS